MSSKFLNLDTDDTLGGASSSDEKIASQKAVKAYVDNHSSTVNDAALTIQKNGTEVAVFTANASSNVTANITVPEVTSIYTASGTDAVNGVAVSNAIATKQDVLVSGTTIKTLNGVSLLGSGNITIETSSTPSVDAETISYNSNEELQTIAVKNVRDNSVLPIWQGTEAQWEQGEVTPWYYWQTASAPMWSNGTMPSASWESIAYGNGLFVTTGSGKEAYSTNGINWVQPGIPKGSWNLVAYGNGKFIAVTSNKAAYSTDGITWTASTLPSSANWTSVAYGNNKFVVIAGEGSDKAIYSTDGITWTESTLPSSAYWMSVTYGNGIFIAVSKYSKSKGAYSTDGITWTEISLPISSLSSVTYGNNLFVAVTFNKAAYSTDGITWTTSTLPSSDYDEPKITYGDGKFVVVSGISNLTAYSTDGITWTASTLPSSYWNSITYGDGKFVVITGEGSDKAAYSTDGITWTASTLPSSTYWKSVTYGDGKFVAVTSSGFTYSLDGINWKSIFPYMGSYLYYWVYFLNNTFIAIDVSGGKTGAYSTDGITWISTTLPNGVQYNSMTYGDNKFVAVGGGTTDKGMYSTDGINWSELTLPNSGTWKSVAYGNGKFIAIRSDSTSAAYSTNGINWSSLTLPASGDFRLIFANGKFMLFSYKKTIYSTDGTNWTTADNNLGISWGQVIYDGEKFVAVWAYSSKLSYSTDGINWTTITTLPFSDGDKHIAYGDDKYVIVTSDSNVSSSAVLTFSSGLSCFTSDQIPTTSSIVYSEPATPSALTVSSVTSGAITLSDNNTYYYNQSGNQNTYETIGVAHPNYLCFINGVGVKIGTTTIATNYVGE